MKHVKMFEAFVNDKPLNEKLTSKTPEEVITIDLDMAGPDDAADEKAAKASFKKFKIEVKPNGNNNGMGHDVTGKKKDILAYLQSEFYEMDDETIQEYYPELLD
jgi:hypothetical protein